MKSKSDLSPLAQRSIALIKKIPKGKVLTYGAVSTLIGAPGCARHISYILSSSSKKYALPWHRVLSSQGKISLSGTSELEQMKKLKQENIEFKFEKSESLKSIVLKVPSAPIFPEQRH